MKDNDKFSKFIQKGDFCQELIDEIQEYFELSDKQLIKKTFKYLNSEIGDIENNSFFELVITNATELLCILCSKIEFDEKEVTINRIRIKKSREALLANANKFKNQVFMDAANKLDEIVLDKNINLDDLKSLLIRLIEKKEDINIIKKLLNTNKGVLFDLFDYVFNLSLESLNNNTADIYYYISLLKVFYTSKIDKKEYIAKLNMVSNNQNEFANEIYMIILGVKRSLNPEEIIKKYGIVDCTNSPFFIISKEPYDNDIIITIDKSGTILRDDGISITKDGNNYIVGIHIADPTIIVKPNSQEDLIARNNYKCIYMLDGSTRLLSKDLEKNLTLDENQSRNTISMYVTIDNEGNIKDYYIMENVIRVSSNLSYYKSNTLFDNYEPVISKILINLYECACLLEKQNPTKKIYWYKKDNSSFEKRIQNSKSDKIVSELMVLYNRLIPTIICNEGLPYIYRIQDPSYIKTLIKKMGIEIDEATMKVIDSIYLNSKYSPYPRFHSGLHVPIYSHSSDTLRRYPDMYNAFLIHAFHFKNLKFDFNQEEFNELISYFNQRNIELSLMKSEYERSLKLKKS